LISETKHETQMRDQGSNALTRGWWMAEYKVLQSTGDHMLNGNAYFIPHKRSDADPLVCQPRTQVDTGAGHTGQWDRIAVTFAVNGAEELVLVDAAGKLRVSAQT
jgi:hypothetical protein